MKARRKFVPIGESTGKTIEYVYCDETHQYVIVSFGDGTYTNFHSFGELANEPLSYELDDMLSVDAFIDTGIYTKDDIDEHERKNAEILAAQERAIDLESFERLKKKLGITS